MIKQFSILIAVLGILIAPVCYSKAKVLTGYVEVLEDQSLKEFLVKRIKLPKKFRNRKFVKKIYKLNPRVKNFRKLKKGTFIFVEIPGIKTAKKKTSLQKTKEKPKEMVKKEDSRSWLSIFQAVSYGSFVQENDVKRITSSQDSPFTFGLSGGRKLDWLEGRMYLSGSFYFSYFDSSFSEVEGIETIPLEVGTTTYLNFRPKSLNLAFYGGVDFESFNTFDFFDEQADEDLEINKNNLLFFALGVETSFNLFSQKILVKSSVGTTIVSQTDNEGEAYTGYKAILFLAGKFSKNWGAQFFAKQHMLEGEESLEITRLGLGLNYSFF